MSVCAVPLSCRGVLLKGRRLKVGILGEGEADLQNSGAAPASNLTHLSLSLSRAWGKDDETKGVTSAVVLQLGAGGNGLSKVLHGQTLLPFLMLLMPP